MTDQEFEKRVREVMQQDGLAEGDARLKVGIEAGMGGDVVGHPAGIDPVGELKKLGDAWAPLDDKEGKDARSDQT